MAATFASIGLPGFANFWGELPIFVALWRFSHWATVVALSGTIVSAVYGLRAAARVFFGPPSDAFARVCASTPPADIAWGERLPALVLLSALFFIGIWPRSISAGIDRALAAPSDAVVASLGQPLPPP
jgi:NADH-quinone oxidoreductase subunit M